MGYITTISIYNDGAYNLKANPTQLAEVMYNACTGVYTAPYRNHRGSAGLGSHANMFTIQAPRHADEKTVYVHAGNTVVEMNPYSERCQKICDEFPDFFDELLSVMETKVKQMKEMKKNREKNDK
jgi:hypothetical protein